MACYHPIPALQDGPGAQPRLWPPLGTANLALPCGKCIGCRTDRATQWANRCSHEASLWPGNVFLTLTYDDENLPPDGHLRPSDLQRFLKRLRRHADRSRSVIDRSRSAGIRFFACGEYGEHGNRPHYHALLFNCRFTDTHQVGKDLEASEKLRELWPHGDHKLGKATPAAASYIAQYSMKKQGAGDHDSDGVWRPAPFLRMSLKPAIGTEWLKRYHSDLTHGYLVNNGRQQRIPRTYRTKLKDWSPLFADEIDGRIGQQMLRNADSDRSDPARLRDAELIHHRRKELTERRKL